MATFTVYLLRKSIKAAADAVDPAAHSQDVLDGKRLLGTLFVRQIPATDPKWSKFFVPLVDPKTLGQVQSSAGVFIVFSNGRFFALTFGHGRHLLLADAYEERFGLLVALNSIGEEDIRSIDKRAFIDDQNSRVQTSQPAAALEFGIDIERDLVRAIVGNPLSPLLGRKLSGSDALTVTADLDIGHLRPRLARFLKAFQATDYRDRFPWVDKVRQLNPDGQVADELNGLMLDRLKAAWKSSGIVEGCWLSIPDIVDWQIVHGFKFTGSKKEGVWTDLHLPGLVAAYGDQVPSLEFLKARHAFAVDEDEHVIEKWPVYRCIQCEIDHGGKSFVLSNGRWFEVEKDFESEIRNYVAGITVYPKPLLVYNHEDEEDYNKALVLTSGGSLCLMDRKFIKAGGVHNKVEFCDAYGGGEIIHVKQYGSSSVLGHLFNQGLISGELLKSQKNYVELVNDKLDVAHQLPLTMDTPRILTDYTVVFGVITQSTKPGLHLPFFAMVVLKNVCSRLRDLGYKDVMLAKIECDPAKKVAALPPGKGPGKKAASGK